MKPNDPAAAHAYHERTKHSVESVQRNAHRLDWAIQPLPFKIYEELAPIALPRDLEGNGMPTLEAIARGGPTDVAGAGEGAPRIPDARQLARIFYYSAGITKERVYSSGQHFYFRAAACTGALYHIDLYLVCGDLSGVEAGVYHFGPHDFALRRLRAGDHREALVRATAAEPSIARAPAVVVCASTFWRNSWKYQARAYRHCWWDSGTLLAHLLAVAGAEDLPTRVVLGFVDREVNALLGLDGSKEAALALVSIGCADAVAATGSPALEALSYSTRPLSTREVEYPAIPEMHEASSLADADSVRAWRDERNFAGLVPNDTSHAEAGDSAADGSVLAPLGEPPAESLECTVTKRGSTRQFGHEPMSFGQLSTLLERSLAPIAFDFRPAGGPALDDVYVIVNCMDGLGPGSYALLAPKENDARASLQRLHEGSFRREAGFLGLGQELPADAALNVYFLSSLDRVLAQYGARGYRAAELEAAIHGGRVYLAAYALGLGATGLTFFDDDVTSFFSPHAAGKAVMFLVAVGRPRKRKLRGG